MDESIDIGALAESAREVLANESPIEAAQRYVNGEHAEAARLWGMMADLGWLAICAPERIGGLALGTNAACVLSREVGRALAPVPLLHTLIAVDALSRAQATDPVSRWLEQAVGGALRVTIGDVFGESGVRLVRSAGSLKLQGEIRVWDAAEAGLLLVPVQEVDGAWTLAALDRASRGLEIAMQATIDGTRDSGVARLADVELDADRLLSFEETDPQRATLRLAALGVAADSLGGGEAILERTIEYLKLREQFGKPIGSFQALKHRVADHKAALIGAQALVDEAAGADATLADALEAKALATQVYLTVARDCIQLHGGIGFTWEHPAHLYLKRALVNSMMFGRVEATLDHFLAELEA